MNIITAQSKKYATFLQYIILKMSPIPGFGDIEASQQLFEILISSIIQDFVKEGRVDRAHH